MTPDLHHDLTNIPLDELRPIVCQVLGVEAVPLAPLSVVKIGRSAGTATAGIFRVTGNAKTPTGERPWSAVVKVLGASEIRQEAMDMVAAQRELAVYRSGVFAAQQGGVRSPFCYAIQERDELHFIWMEDLSGAPHPPWIPEYYLQTAHHFGKFNAHWLEEELPDWEWLSKDNFRWMYDDPFYHETFKRLAELQKHPLAGLALPQEVFQGLLHLWDESQALFSQVEATYKGVCHGDCHPKNLFPIVDAGTGSYTIAFDWASVGIENLGSDPGLLVASPIKWMELSVDDADALVEPVFNAYLAGMSAAGWSGNEEQVRLTYLTCLGTGEAIRVTGIVASTAGIPAFQATLEKLFMRPAEEIYKAWAEVYRFYLARHHEAMQLARRLCTSN